MLTESQERPQDLILDGVPVAGDVVKKEKKGRAWLLWSFVVCPCHLPVTMAVIGTVLGGTAFGAFLSRNVLGVGLTFGALYIVGLAIGFRHLRAASAGKNCSGSSCETIPTP